MTYIELAILKAELGIDTTNHDAMLERFIARAQTTINSFCNRAFEAIADTTRRFDAATDVDGYTLYLDHDLCAITSITNGDGTAVTSGQYVTEPRNTTPWYALTLKSSAGMSWTYTTDPEQAIAITGRWAWSQTAPADIQQACALLSRYYYDRRDTGLEAVQQASTSPSGAVLVPNRLPRDVAEILRPYMRVAI